MSAFKDNITDPDFWLRVLYTLLFAFAWWVVTLLLAIILVLQVGFRLFTGAPQSELAGLGNSLSQYAWQMGRYAAGTSDVKPWPFIEWPAADAEWQLRLPRSSAMEAESVAEAEPAAPIVHPADDLAQPEPPTVQPIPEDVPQADTQPGDRTQS